MNTLKRIYYRLTGRDEGGQMRLIRRLLGWETKIEYWHRRSEENWLARRNRSIRRYPF